MLLQLPKLTVVSVLLLGALISAPVHAATVSDQDIAHQETVVRAEATETLQAYLRLVLYALVQQLETRIDNA